MRREGQLRRATKKAGGLPTRLIIRRKARAAFRQSEPAAVHHDK